MPIQRSRAPEAARLVAALVTGPPTTRQAAAARLVVLGVRSVPHLRSALDTAVRAHDDESAVSLVDVLAAVAPAEVLAHALGDTAGPRHADALVEAWQFALGADDTATATSALDRLTALAVDAGAPRSLRQRALGALRASAPDVVAPLEVRLAAELDDGLVAESGDGAVSAPAARDATIDTIRQRVTCEGEAPPLPELHQMVVSLRQAAQDAPPETATRAHLTRALVHQVLARRGSTVALYDICGSLERDPVPLPVGIFDAVADIGDAASLDSLVVAWTRMPDAWSHTQLQRSAAAIVARHGLGPRHSTLRRLRSRCPELLEGISTPSRSTPSPRRARRT